MSSSLEQRLASWRAVVRDGSPRWLVDAAPRIVRQLEAEQALAAGAQSAETNEDSAQSEGRQSGGEAVTPNTRQEPQDD